MGTYFIGMAQKTVTGKVTGENKPLPGATVSVKGTTKSTQTGSNGEFKIDATDGDMLIITNVGYQTREARATEAGAVTLEADAKNMSEVVVNSTRY